MPKERVRLASTKPCRTSPGSDLYSRPPQTTSLLTAADQDADASSMTSSTSSGDVTTNDCSNSNESSLSNLIVNYLPQTMSQEDMKSLFSSVGDMESCRLIRDKSTSQSLGYGFVKYRSVETANKAISLLNGLRLQNKTIKVSVARPSSDCIKGANLYVGGLPKHVTNQDLLNWFAPCGQIVTARVLCDPQSGHTRGVGFVRFNLKSEAETAIRLLSGTVPPGALEPITVKFANQPTVAKTTVPTPLRIPSAAPATTLLMSQQQQHSNNVIPHNAPVSIRYPTMAAPFDPLLMTPFPVNTTPSLGGATVAVSNMPPEVDESALCLLFAPFGGVQSIYVLPGQRVALVTMFNCVEAMNAVSSLNGLTFNGYTIQVSLISNNTPALQVTPGNSNPSQLTVLPLGHSMAADNGRLMPFFLPSLGLPASAGHELTPLTIM